jgi:hypothetical protein
MGVREAIEKGAGGKRDELTTSRSSFNNAADILAWEKKVPLSSFLSLPNSRET